MKQLSRIGVAAVALWVASAVAQQPAPDPAVVVVFTPATAEGDADAILSAAGLARVDHPDLLPHQRIVIAPAADVRELSRHPQVAAIFRASRSLTTGVPVHGCEAAPEESGSKTLHRASIGSGWGQQAALTWSISSYPGTLAPEVVDAILTRALDEWARHGGLRFTRTSQLRARRNIEFLFGSGDHGDAYPFPVNHTLLAHAFYPASVNPEPVAGDVHLNAAEAWSEGGDRDLYSAVLHEVGHALGLTHSSTPGTVMYPYYRELSSLAAEDITELQSLYGPPDGAPLSIDIGGTALTASASTELQGTVSGGNGEVAVTWSANGAQGIAAGGRSWTASSVPLVPGSNEIQIRAVDSEGGQAVQTYVVTRSEAAGPAPVTATPAPVPAASTASDRVSPTLSILSPGTTMYSTTSPTVRVSGSARDNVGVTEVTWEAGSAGGRAQGTSAWTVEIPLLVGDNSVVIRAWDGAGNAAWRSLLVIRR